jgi:hypothetical protein
MKRIEKIIATACLILLLPAALTYGQDKKTEQRIKVVVAEDGGSKVLIDTLITGDSPKDTIIMKEGRTIYLTRAAEDNSDEAGGSKRYVVTTTVTDGNGTKKEVKKEVRIISSDSDMQTGQENVRCKQAHCEGLVSGSDKDYTFVSVDKESGADMAKYVISRNGLKITVEGSDYDKVKEVIKNIEKTLDDLNKTK